MAPLSPSLFPWQIGYWDHATIHHWKSFGLLGGTRWKGQSTTAGLGADFETLEGWNVSDLDQGIAQRVGGREPTGVVKVINMNCPDLRDG